MPCRNTEMFLFIPWLIKQSTNNTVSRIIITQHAIHPIDYISKFSVQKYSIFLSWLDVSHVSHASEDYICPMCCFGKIIVTQEDPFITV